MNLIPENKYLKIIGNLADEQGIKAFVVGGFVRDFILGIEDTDIDIMVIGDGIKFAKDVSQRISKPLDAVYKNFGTALLESEEYKIEFASARKESYDRDSRKPKVEEADLNDDLSR